jgi:signal transduction histidine kinase
VIGKPHAAFYAGKKITSPCGYPLGVLCIIDTKPRPEMTDIEKQNFSDLAEMVMDEFTVRKHDHENRIKERRRILAYTAHDLLTPLTTIQLNVGLLKEDTSKVLNSYQKKLVEDTACCSQFMSDYCHESMTTFRGENNRLRNGEDLTDSGEIAQSIVNLPNLFQEVDVIMKAHIKRVPLTFEISDELPDFIFSSHLRIVQAALNILSNACIVTQEGFIHAKVYVKKEMKSGQLEKSLSEKDTRDCLYFECLDTGPELKKSAVEEPFFRAPTKDMNASIATCVKSHMRPNNKSRLGIYSVSRHIAILGGRFGYHNS